MSDMKKFINILTESTTAGSVATVAQGGAPHRRDSIFAAEGEQTDAPDTSSPADFDLWRNSTLAGKARRIKRGEPTAKVDKTTMYPQLKSSTVTESAINPNDTVWAKDPTKPSKTITGQVINVTPGYITIKHKDGTTGQYQPQYVSHDFETLNPNPYRKPVNELSTDALSKYKKAASADASAADAKGDFKRGNRRFSGIVKATKKQFANDDKRSEVSEEMIADRLKHELDLFKKGESIPDRDISSKPQSRDLKPPEPKKSRK